MSNVIDFKAARAQREEAPSFAQEGVILQVPAKVPILACHCMSTNFEMLLDGHIRCARCGSIDMSWVKPK